MGDVAMIWFAVLLGLAGVGLLAILALRLGQRTFFD
jgi:hypothetical protein